MKKVLAFDFGASSGRAVLACICEGKLKIKEIHRFKNEPVTVNGRMYWDILRLFHEIKNGITAALQNGGFDAVSIDTWGVDFGLIDKNGELLANPVHYRDNRTEGIQSDVFKIIPEEEIYRRTGIQFMRINTLYQLMYLKLNKLPLSLCAPFKLNFFKEGSVNYRVVHILKYHYIFRIVLIPFFILI